MSDNNINKIMRAIPGMDIMLDSEWGKSWISAIGRATVKNILNQELALLRRDILDNKLSSIPFQILFPYRLLKSMCIVPGMA